MDIQQAAQAGLPHATRAGRLPVGDDWRATLAREEVFFPHDGSAVATSAVADLEDVEAALSAAAAVKRTAGRLPAHVRRGALLDVQRELEGRRYEIIDVLVLESGKPRVDCSVEVDRTVVTLGAAADEVSRLHGETVVMDLLPSGEGLTGYWLRKPIGVVAAITGFNYPLMLAAHKIAPAIAAGCAVIVKPAPQTPLATLWLVDALRRALVARGGPAAMVQLVAGGVEIGRALTTDARVSLVSFTGSAQVGHAIAREAAPTKVVLELGSNAALVVAADADLDAAAGAVVRGGFYASGQACISVQRVIVEEAVRDALVAKATTLLQDVRPGDPRDPSTRVAALIDGKATARVRGWIDEAVAGGATRVTGQQSTTDRTLTPTLLLDPPTTVDAWNEEIFGPVVALRSVPSFAAAIDAVNESRYGLHVSVFTSSMAHAQYAIDNVDAGGVVINEVPGFRSDTMPYGGVKDSGTGREGPRFAVEEMTVPKMVIIRAATTAAES